MYDANNRRFMASDPIKDGANWYVYVGNSPVVFVDPSGLVLLSLHDMVMETSGASINFVGNGRTGTAIVNGVTFTGRYSNGSILVDSANFARVMGLNNRFGSFNCNLSKKDAELAIRSEYANEMMKQDPSYKLRLETDYWLDFNGNDILVNLSPKAFSINVVRGDVQKLIRQNGGAYSLEVFMRELYINQFGYNINISTGAIALEILMHATPAATIQSLPKIFQTINPLLKYVYTHARTAEIGFHWGVENGEGENTQEIIIWEGLKLLEKILPRTAILI